ncbi:hypothetical protein RIF23_10645 [Lipingzhangella sp. LS1_29]|uniref:Uncharacterized protein n=1 Tax=Lipingzhangella rawalii TaxID=2055835 RepID=A0ABU2H634_9ACTN|nr:hypothetical protein [Lipingzhangella rawalii]MDS1270758.1 hypothetical protein [Lipingzhangella rawalii]
MSRPWEADTSAEFRRRLGKSALELGDTKGDPTCPDIWEMRNGDIAVVGRDVTEAYQGRLPSDVSISHDERLVIIPRDMLLSAKPDIPNA